MIKYVDNKGKLHMLVLLVFTLFSKKSTLYMGGLLLWGLPGGRRETISPLAALLGLVRGMGLAKRCSGCPRGLLLEGAVSKTTCPCPDQ